MRVSGGLVIWMGILLIVASLIILIYLGICVTRPYLDTKDWEQAVCTVTKSSKYHYNYGDLQDIIPKNFVPCVADHTSKTMYEEDIFLTPCTDIEVTYIHPQSGRIKATLYNDIDSIGQDTWNATCSMIVCKDGAFKKTASDEAEFTAEFGFIGTEHACYYSENDKERTIAQRYSRPQVLAGMLVPSAFFIIGVIIVIVGCIIKYRVSDE